MTKASEAAYKAAKAKMPSFQQEPGFQDVVNERKRELKHRLKMDKKEVTVVALAEILQEEIVKKRLLEEEDKFIKLTRVALDQLIIERMEAENLDSVRLKSGALFFPKEDVYCSVEDRPKVVAYYMENRPDMLTINPKTLGADTKENLINGLEPPPGVKTFLKTTVGYRDVK